MARMQEYLFASLLCLLILSCKDEEMFVENLAVPNHRSITTDRDTSWFRFNKDYFPHGIGVRWQYLLSDSASGRIDSVALTVVSDSFANNGFAYRLELRIGNYEYPTGDFVGFDGESRVGWGFVKSFAFPLFVDKNWGWDYGDRFDMAKVKEEASIEVKAGAFETAFQVVE